MTKAGLLLLWVVIVYVLFTAWIGATGRLAIPFVYLGPEVQPHAPLIGWAVIVLIATFFTSGLVAMRSASRVTQVRAAYIAVASSVGGGLLVCGLYFLRAHEVAESPEAVFYRSQGTGVLAVSWLVVISWIWTGVRMVKRAKPSDGGRQQQA